MNLSRRQTCFGMAAAFAGASCVSRADGQDINGSDFLGAGTVNRITSGDSFVLQDGRKVRLAGVEAPRRSTGKAVAQPLAATAKAKLEDFILDQDVRFIDPAPDRFGRLRAHVVLVKDDRWVQGEMLRLGLARVRTWRDDFARSEQMLILENTARNNQEGIWKRMFYAVRDPKAVSSSEGSFQLVEGEIVDAASSSKMIYLNFGIDWRKDFTAQVTKKTAKLFVASGIELLGLSGARVRVRGTVRYNNGPVVWLNHPSQLEILSGD